MANYNPKRSSEEPTLTDRVRTRIESMGRDTEFSIADFRDIPTNVSSALKKLEGQGEILKLERRKIEGERFYRNFYIKTSSRIKKDKEGKELYTFQGWENVYPEFFSTPSFKVIQIIKVGERI